MKRLSHPFAAAVLAMASLTASAAVTDVTANGWFEGGYATWTKVEGYSYNVYVQNTSESTWTKLDTELVREYPDCGRADAVGLKAGEYRFKIVPVKDKAEITADATVSGTFTATPYDRGGFAHFRSASTTYSPAAGVGAYRNDGTLKAGAKVIYVTADNAKTITTTVKTGSKDTNITECTGFQTIVDAYQKGYDTTPLDFRIIGKLSDSDMDKLSSSAEGMQIKGKGAYSELNITIEGIGHDATIHGFGFLIRNACSVEMRNLALMWFKDDGVSMDTDNSNLWIHNLDVFYGKPGSAADQKKGDGSLDIKGDSKYSTISYNHLWDAGKTSLCGMTSETGPNYLSYHHNWFDHSDSRHPRIRTMSVHVYNNYFDGNSKYGVGSTMGSDVFVENNYFRNCKYPMLTSLQGSDVHNGTGSKDDTKGTFSGEAGGSIKAFGNFMTGHKSFEPYVSGHATYSKHFDAYVVENKADKVPETVVSLSGSNTYSNFDTDPSLMYTDYKLDNAGDIPAIVTGELGAGRCQHGDFKWTFSPAEDTNDAVIQELSDAINAYKPSLMGFFGNSIGGKPTEPVTPVDPDQPTDPDTPSTGDDTEGTVLYKHSITGAVDAAVVDGVTMSYSEPIATQGGTFTYGNVNKIEASEHSSTKYAIKLDGDASATSTKYVLVTLDKELQAGDKINVSCYASSNPSASKPYGVSIYSDPANTPLASVTNQKKNVEETLTISVPEALVGAKAFYLFRNPKYSVYLTAVSVTASATGINGIQSKTSAVDGAIYDLTGRKTNATVKGKIYIKNNKKFIMR
ncbi:MAG: pectate lyase [Prevotellaceae bacterium]|nr:pectate lyase [Prevotellaceae bacterium]MDO4931835.1 pectate lyase [Prevotellaceae bacterium]